MKVPLQCDANKQRSHHCISETRQKLVKWTVQMITGLKKVDHRFNCGVKKKKMREKGIKG